MFRPRQWIGPLLLCALFAAGFILYAIHVRPSAQSARRHGRDAAFEPQVYLWQRAWTPQLKADLLVESPHFARTVILARQIDWDSGDGGAPMRPHIIRTGVDWRTVKSAGIPAAAALRISTYSGPFSGASARAVAQCARDIIHDAAASGVTLAELQVDFDAPTSKLGGYRIWLAEIRKIAGTIPVTFTALPTWLNSPAFGPLAGDAGYFVLQVHWLEHPRRLADPLVLCDLPTARRAIQKAAAFSVPFRVALPTYSYAAAFNADGSFAGMVAENAPPNWAESKTVRLIESNPEPLAAFVNELAADRPISLTGIIWYRLPLDSDRLNWSWTTLQSVMAGRIPAPGKLVVHCQKTSPALADIQLANSGQRDIEAASEITLTWDGAALLACDALGGFQIAGHTAHSLRLVSSGGWQSRLKPGESRPIGWLRLSKDTPIHAALQ